MESLTELKQFLQNLDRHIKWLSYETVKDELRKVGLLQLYVTQIPVGDYILRCRTELNDGNKTWDKYFVKEQDVSYFADIEKITPGRLNWQGVPMFYGTTKFYFRNQSDPQFLAYFEAGKIFKPNSSNHEEYSVIGKWRIKTPLNVTFIVPPPDECANDQELQYIMNRNSAFKKNIPTREPMFHFLDSYINYHFRKDVTDSEIYRYKISCAIADIIFENSNVDAIMYKSAKTPQITLRKLEGYNIAVHPRAINKLKLEDL